MKKSRFSEEPARRVRMLKEAEAGVPIADLCRRLGGEGGDFLSLEGEVWRARGVGSQAATGGGDRSSSTWWPS